MLDENTGNNFKSSNGSHTKMTKNFKKFKNE